MTVIKIFGKKRILVIEDDPSGASLLIELLKLNGYEMSWAKNGQEGLDMIEKAAPDLIFLDIAMPQISGIDVLKILKMRSQTKNIPVLICSASHTLNQVEECCKIGALGYITKPYEPERVLQKVKLLFNEAG